MKKTIILLSAIIGLTSCKKEELKENDVPITLVVPTPATLKLTRDFNALAVFHHCYFTYTEVDGTEHFMDNQTDMQVENVDFTKPFSVEASAGITFYDPINGNNYQPQVCSWQLKKDGFVIDTQTTFNYTYENQ